MWDDTTRGLSAVIQCLQYITVIPSPLILANPFGPYYKTHCTAIGACSGVISVRAGISDGRPDMAESQLMQDHVALVVAGCM